MLHAVPLGSSGTVSFSGGNLAVGGGLAPVFHGDPDAAGGSHLPLRESQRKDAAAVVGTGLRNVRRFGEADGPCRFAVGPLNEVEPAVGWVHIHVYAVRKI